MCVCVWDEKTNTVVKNIIPICIIPYFNSNYSKHVIGVMCSFITWRIKNVLSQELDDY